MMRMSPLTQGRGLKFYPILPYSYYCVAPHAGAWIEIECEQVVDLVTQSPLTQGRGLKLDYLIEFALKHVAPHAGAWIEIYNLPS